jgi:hypothetical protein
MRYKSVGKKVFQKNLKNNKWESIMTTISDFHAKQMVKTLQEKEDERNRKA